MSGPAPMRIELDGVGKTFGRAGPESVVALRDVSFTIEPSSFVSVEGPSGCGKTSLLNLIGLLDHPSQGRVILEGTDSARWRERERARRRLTRIGFIFQRFYLLPNLTAQENVELPLKALGTPPAQRKRRVAELIEKVGLTHRATAFPHQLSGGEEQRVAVARALANAPGLLLADEPTGELDSTNANAILELLLDAHRTTGATVVLVTHNPRVAARARRHLTMADGRIVSDVAGA